MREFYSLIRKKYSLVFFVITFLLGSVPLTSLLAQSPEVITTSGTWTVPAGVSSVKVEVWGGGGGGGGTIGGFGLNGTGGGGGGGSYKTAIFTVNPGDVYSITVGAGGTAGLAGIPATFTNGTNGGTGGTTTFTGPGGTVSTLGGGGGSAGNFGIGNGGAGGIGGINGGAGGSIGSSPSGNGTGGGGGAGNSGVGGDGSDIAAGIGGAGTPNMVPYIGGNGGAPQTPNGPVNNGNGPGGGGSGGRDDIFSGASGGAGAPGQVVLTYTINLTPTITGFTPGSGCANTTPVVITGTNFTGATAVQFGGTNALSFTVNSATQITATPAAGTTGTITVITPGGTVTSAGSFTINPLPAATISYLGTPYCSNSGTATVTRTGQTGGTYSASPAGLSINSSTGDVNLSASTAGTYTVTYTFTNGTCPNTTTAQITVTAAPSATISYSGSPFCTNSATGAVTRTGTAGGMYSASPAGLSINPTTGAITPSGSTPGTYTVTYTIAASGGCAEFTTTTSVIINALPVAAISYSGSPYCSNSGTATVTRTGQTGGTYSSTAGLSINSSTGDVNLSASTAGTYTVTYTFTNGTCPNTTTAQIIVTAAPSATISYSGSPFCTDAGTGTVTRTGTAGGTYSASPAGLSINPTTGAITPSGSTPGTYTVTYTIAASGGCAEFTKTTSVIINALPVAAISYNGSPYCSNSGTATVTRTGQTGGTYSASPAGLSINSSTGDVNLSASTAGTYTVTYTFTNGTCPNTTTAQIIVTAAPSATISYSGSPFCTDAGTGTVTRTGTAGGTYSASPAGLSINPTTGAITPSGSAPGTYTVTYTIAASGGCAEFATTTSVTINALPVAAISYSGSPYCSNSGTATVTRTGQTGGTYSSTAGLSINSSTGDVNLSASTAGTYTVSYTIAAAGGCAAVVKTASITITAAPSATISYSGSPFCTNASTKTVIRTGTAGGTYSALPAGLSINPTTGTITPSGSTPGTYTVTYTIAASGGCGVFTTTTSVTINALPSAAISYSGSPYCSNSGTATVTQTGQTGGTYSSTAGLSINSSTGDVNLSASTAGTYTVSYTIAASGGCAAVVKTASITITAAPSATISYSGSPFCTNSGTGAVTRTGTVGGTYSASPAGLSINPTTGAITPSGSTPGTYTVTYTIAASGGCAEFTTTTSVTINALPAAAISYSGSPYCSNSGTATVTQTGQTGGTYSASPAGLSINSSTGDVNLSASTAGTYTVSYTIAASGGCAAVVKTASITVTSAPSATISYSGSSFCTNASTKTVTRTGTAGGTYSALPAGLSINPTTGTITPSGSTPGTYTVTYTIAASGGCGVFTTTTSITINSLPTAGAITGSHSVCINSNITLTPNASGTAPFTYTWSSSNTAVATVGTTTGIVLGKAVGTTNITYTVTDANGCTSATSPNFAVTTTKPTANPITGPSSVCVNGTIDLNSNATGTAPLTYTWASSDNSKATVNNTGLVTGLAAGTVNITYTVTDGNGCSTTSAAYSLTIIAAPTGIFSASATTICTGSSVTFTAPTGYSSYTFYVNGTKSQGPNSSNTFSSSSLTNGASVTVDVANALNCGATFGPIVITVNPLPTVTLSASPSGAICPGTPVTFTATGGTNYTFKINNSTITSNTTGTFTSSTLNNGDVVSVDVTDGNSCMATSSITMNVNALPSGTLSSNPANGIICAGDAITFTATAAANTTYDFRANGVSLPGQTGTNVFTTSSLTGSPVISVIATNASGCAATFNAIPVTVNSLPVVSVVTTENSGASPNDNNICAGGNVTFTATPGFSSYKFYLRGTGAPLSSVGNVYSSSSLVEGDYVTVVATNNNGCSNIPVSSATIHVLASPSGTLSVSPNPVCQGQNVTLTASSDPSYNRYVFKANGTPIFTSTSTNTYTNNNFINGQSLTADVTNTNGCVTTFGPVVITVNTMPSGTISVSPNSTICKGESVTFTAPGGFTNYDWQLNGASLNLPSQNTYTTNALSNNDKVSVAVSTGQGCIGLLNTITMVVNPRPANSLLTGPSEVCVNDNITLQSTTSGGTWNTLNPAIATVSGGVVTGVSAGTTTISYTITNVATGCDSTVTKDIMVNALPVVANISPLNPKVCAGSTVQLTSSPAGGTWGSDNANATVDNSGLVTGVSAGTATISYTVTNAQGCVTVKSILVTINALPVIAPITFQSPASSFDVCVGNNITLLDATSGSSHTWSSSNTNVATINSAGVVTGVSPTINGGITTIRYTVTDGNACSAFVEQDVQVNPLPVPTLTGANPICPNATETYTTEAGQSNYIWTMTGGRIVGGGSTSDNTITIVWDQPGIRSIYVNYTNAFGCTGATSATLTTSTGTVPVITPNPAPAVCLNTDGTYTTNAGMTNYVWTATGGTVVSGGTTNVATVNWTTTGPGSVSVNFTDANGCVAATPTVRTVQVNPLPTLITHDQAVCSPGTVDLTAAAVTAGSTSGLTFSYYTDAAGTITLSNPNAIATSGTYYIKGTTAAGCSDVIKPVTVTINPLPTLVITNPAPVCSPSTVDITAASVTAGSTSGLTFSYYTNAAGTITLSNPNAIATSGTYYIKGTTAAGCSDVIKPVTVTINPLPTLVITNPAPVCSPSTVDITAASVTVGSTSGLTFSYYTDAAGTTTLSNPNAIATSGTYYIKGTTAAGCSDVIKPVTVTINSLPTLVITNPAPVCSPSTVDITAASVTAGSTSGLTFSYYTDAAGTITLSNPNAIASSGTYYIKGTTAAGCSDVIKPVTVTINPLPTLVITNPAPVCSPSTVDITAASVTAGSTSGLTFSYYTNAAGTITLSNPNAIATSGTYYIKGSTAAGCSDVIKPVTVTINPLPTLVITNPAPVCSPSTVDITAASVTAGSTSGLTFSYYTNAAGTITLPNPNAIATSGTYYIKGTTAAGCADVIKPVTVTISTSTPFAANITASPSTICLGASSNLSIPNGTSNLLSENFEGTSSFTVVNGSPHSSGASWTVRNSPYDYDYDCFLIIFCQTVTFRSGSHFMVSTSRDNSNTNTSLVSPTISTVGYASLNLQYRTYYRRDNSDIAVVEVSTNNGASWTIVENLASIGNLGTSENFTTRNINLNAYVNTPSLKIRFRYQNSDQWWWAIDDINLTGSAPADLYSWSATPSATAGLPAGSGIPSAANANINVVPTAAGSYTYTAILTNAAGCTSTKDVVIPVNPLPAVSISADYCLEPGKVVLTATYTPGSTIKWYNNKTTDTVHVDEAGEYSVTATTGGCSVTAFINIAQELVINGDFTNGNTGFTSDYAYKPDVGGNNELVDDSGNNAYSVTTNGQNVHNNFWGQDHTGNTTGPRNFMAVNGHGDVITVWKQTVNVLPNTTYYFSAWAMSLNSAGPFAQLQFSVNGTLTGTTAILASHGESNGSPDNWVRFYGTWTSGPTTTTAEIYINDLQPSRPGNDFGLDDISFGTLSTFITLESAPGTDAQTPCVNTPITPIVYSVGSTASGPTISPALPPGLTSSFNGILYTISGTPTVPGPYTYTLTTTGSCLPSTATGTINTQAQTIQLSAGSQSPTVCVNTPVNISFTLGGVATGATILSGPAFLTGSGSPTYTVTGTPTVAGVYPYTIVTTGTSCTPDTIRGNITVQEQTITLSSGNTNQIVCINKPVSDIRYSIGGPEPRNASVSGLPPGVTGSYQSGFFIITGTPVSPANGVYSYTVTATGACASVTASGTITVSPDVNISLSSAAGSDDQTVCTGSPLPVSLTYIVNNATSASVTGLPAGLSGTLSGNTFTISGTITDIGNMYNYTITALGDCAPAVITGKITVQSQTIELSNGTASPSLCINASMPDIEFTIGGTANAATVTWSPSDLTGVVLQQTGPNKYILTGTPTISGAYTYTITTSGAGACNPASVSGTITVGAAAQAGTLTSISVCSGNTGTITLSGKGATDNVDHWESSATGGAPWTVIPNNTISLSYTNITAPVWYRVQVSNTCGPVYSSVAMIGIHNLWTGAIDSDWNTAGNWSDNQVPSLSCANVYIPNTTNKPVLASGTATIRNLYIDAGAVLTVNGTGVLQIAGTINNNGTFDVSKGSIEMNGTAAQTIPAGAFNMDKVNDLIISNAAGVSLAGKVDVYNSLTYGVNNGTLNTNGNLTLKSTADNTAWIGDMTNHNINGDVTVERYINVGEGGSYHGKSWQFVATPTQGQTVWQSWMEGGTIPVGYGTQIIGPGVGMDAVTTLPSLKYYDWQSTDWIGVMNTANQVYDKRGYMLFVRGDRSVSFPNIGNTTLRTKGTLFTPANQPPSTTVMADKFESVGNPYASAIDMRNILRSGGADEFFILWDPRLTGIYGLGAYQYFSKGGDGNYYATPGGGSYGSGPNNFIQSGQAFFIQATGSNGTVSFNENSKVGGSRLVLRGGRANENAMQLRANLYGVNADAGAFLTDGNLVQFNENYSNKIDGLDARKQLNSAENLAIRSGGKDLAIERRQGIAESDTIFYNLTGVVAQEYRLEFTATGLSAYGLQGYVEDTYLNTQTPLNMDGVTKVNFAVTGAAGSKAASRFRIVFRQASLLFALPVTFVSVKAYQKDADIAVEWQVENEKDIQQYEVEKSTDGVRFSKSATLDAMNHGAQTYQWIDQQATAGNNYYRIKSVTRDGKVAYSTIVKVTVALAKPSIGIYPNPITDGIIHLQFINQPEGMYGIRLLNSLSQVIVSKQVGHAGGNATENIKWDYNLAHGVYHLEVTKPNGEVVVIKVMY